MTKPIFESHSCKPSSYYVSSRVGSGVTNFQRANFPIERSNRIETMPMIYQLRQKKFLIIRLLLLLLPPPPIRNRMNSILTPLRLHLVRERYVSSISSISVTISVIARRASTRNNDLFLRERRKVCEYE